MTRFLTSLAMLLSDPPATQFDGALSPLGKSVNHGLVTVQSIDINKVT